MWELLIQNFHAAVSALYGIELRCRMKKPPGDPDIAPLVGHFPKLNEGEMQDLALDLSLISSRLGVSGFETASRLVAGYAVELQPMKLNNGELARRAPVLASSVVSRVQEIHRAIDAEAGSILFLVVPREDAAFFRSPLADWEKTLERWPDIKGNIEECSQCLALGRHAAAAFHVLQVAEFGVIKVAEFFQVQGDRPGWGAVERLHRLTLKEPAKRSPLERDNFDLLEKMVPLMLAIKTSWRHKLDHVDNQLKWLDTDFSPKLVREIISATQGFMRTLAIHLPTKRE